MGLQRGPTSVGRCILLQVTLRAFGIVECRAEVPPGRSWGVVAAQMFAVGEVHSCHVERPAIHAAPC
jgi:hypothetical protein